MDPVSILVQQLVTGQLRGGRQAQKVELRNFFANVIISSLHLEEFICLWVIG